MKPLCLPIVVFAGVRIAMCGIGFHWPTEGISKLAAICAHETWLAVGAFSLPRTLVRHVHRGQTRNSAYTALASAVHSRSRHTASFDQGSWTYIGRI